MAMANVAVFGGAFLTPVIVGKLTSTLGWEWSFYLVAIFSGACIPVLVFFVPETAYRRATQLNTDFEGDVERRNLPAHANGAGHSSAPPSSEETRAQPDEEKQPSFGNEAAGEVRTDIPPKVTYLQTLMPFNGRKTDEKFLKLLLRPFPLFIYPSILWVSCPN